jgi:cobaltochelatase CobT
MNISSHATEKIAKIISQNFKLKVEIFGDQAYTNGKRMVLPNIPDIPEQYKDVYLGLILHEAGHVKFTKHIKMYNEQHALFYNVFEDVRVEQRIEKQFDGAKDIFKQLYAWAEQTSPLIHDEDHILTTISRHIIRNLRFKQNLLTPIEQPTYDKIAHLVRKTTTSEDSAKLALQVAEALGFEKNEDMQQAEKEMQDNQQTTKTAEQELKEKQKELKDVEKELKEKKEQLKGDSQGSNASGSNGDGDCSDDDDDSDDDYSDGNGDSESDDIDDNDTDGNGSGNGNDTDKTDDTDETKALQQEIKDLKIKKIILKDAIKSLKDVIKQAKKASKQAQGTITAMSNQFTNEAKKQDINPDLLKQLIKALYQVINQQGNGNGKNEKRHIPLTTKFDITEQVTPDKQGKKSYINMVKNQITTFTRIVDQALYAKKKTAYSYSKDEGSIDTRALYSYKVNKNTQIFYQQKNKNVRDIAVEILIDLSGSMHDNIEQVKSASFVISETLTNLNINHEILGFSTKQFEKDKNGNYPELKQFKAVEDNTRFNRFEKLHHFVIKSFNSDDNSPIVNIKSNECNIDGESLLWATNRLLKRPEARKIIFVLSDGEPNGRADVSVLFEDLKKTVKLVESTGVQVLALGINGDHCKEFYADHVELKDKFHNDFCKAIFKYLIEKQANRPKISTAQFDQLIRQYLR